MVSVRGYILTAELCFLKAPYFGGGRKTGLIFGVTGGLSSTMISNAVTWRMTSTWGLTALTFATLLPAMVLACQNHCALSILFYNIASHSSLISLRVEPTRREDAWCFAPDSLPRWTSHQPVCGQCRRCPVRRTHTQRQTHIFLHHFSEWFYCILPLAGPGLWHSKMQELIQ